MNLNKIDAIIIPSNDPHQSEYVSDNWKARAYFSGFNGSAGTLVIDSKLAALWTDSRYFLQFEEECRENEVELYKQSIPHAPEHVEWTISRMHSHSRLGIDFRLFSAEQVHALNLLTEPKKIEIVDASAVVDESWQNKPLPIFEPIIDYKTEFSGASRKQKIEIIHEMLHQNLSDYTLVSNLDDIAWLLNIRSNDADFTPLVTAYLIVGKESTILFLHENRVSEELLTEFNKNKIEVRGYDEIEKSIGKLSQVGIFEIDPSSLNYACFKSIQGKMNLNKSIVTDLKSIKNTTEIEHEKQAMLKDGVALTQFLMWFESYIPTHTISEYDLGKKLESFRMKQEYYQGESFAAIVGYKGNGAIIHYTAPENGSATISNDGILLIDSGAQYLNGTTDITRTFWLGGKPSNKIKASYTAVLKGFIDLQMLKFPVGTKGMQLDAFARQHLWAIGKDYGHGTGHGIGQYGMVHEPGQGFATTSATKRGSAPHLPNQFTTIEPGHYVEGEFGIRIENVVLSKLEENNFISFEALTLCPIETTLINLNELTTDQINWINAYHIKVKNTLFPLLSKEEKSWLKEKCQSI
ncbi:MAG: aminopeptidase P family protein [Crocinitomicaceae bacterium]|nr:aminopeptidase P family protein [Crocinitomicaceae bacterium]